MRKSSFILSLVAIVIAAVSCNKEQGAAVVRTIDSSIVFTAGGEGINVSAETKAVTPVAALDSFYVNCVTGTLGTSEETVFNSSFVMESGKDTYKGGKFWPSTDAGYKFYASNIAMTPAAAGPTVSAIDTVDVICAVLANPTYAASNALIFEHIFARLGKTTVNVQDGYSLSDFTLKITPDTCGVYNLYAGNGKTDGTGWSSKVAGKELTIATASGENAATDAYLVPGNYTLTASYTLTKGEYSVTKTGKTKSVAITGGKINAITASFGGASASDITLTVSITPWGDPVEKNVEFND